MHPPPGHCARLSPHLHETHPIFLSTEDRLAPIASRHDVIERSGKFNPDAPGHAKNSKISIPSVKICTLL
jgi:hypothetical protein